MSRPRMARKRLGAVTQRPGRRRAKRRPLAASVATLRCLVLAIDTAARSGWAAALGQDEYLAFGEADTLDRESLGEIVRWSVCQAAARNLPLVLVLEAPFGGRLTTVMALGAARERWLCAWREASQPLRQVVSVQPAEWRARVLGRGWARAPRGDVRAHEQGVAAALVGERVRGDEAAAILIARWALRAARVAEVLPGARRRP